MRNFLPLVALLAACGPNFETIDDACPETVPGEKDNSEVAVGVFRRIDCYRRFAGISRARMDSRISDAARAHALYVEQNGPEDVPLLEDPGEPSFTGVDPLERIQAQGYELEGNYSNSYGYWEGLFVYDESFDPAAIADDWMWGQYTRQGVLQPGWVDAGYGATDSWAVITIMYDFPAPEATNRPIAWPRDGQTDVPTEWIYAYADGTLPQGDPGGYPVTFTVGSDQRSSSIGSDNPYSLVFSSSSIVGPDGEEVDHNVITPDAAPYDLPYTVTLVPRDPLEANTEYTATVRMRWNSQEVATEFSTTYTTGDDNGSSGERRAVPVRTASGTLLSATRTP